MNERLTEAEEAVRDRFVRASVDVPDIDTMRERVLDALEKDSAFLPERAPSFWSRNKRPASLLLAATAAVAALIVLLPRQPSQTTVVSADNPPSATAGTGDGAANRISFSDVENALARGLPSDARGTWIERTEDERVLTFEFVPDDAEPGDPSRYLRIIAPPAAPTADGILDSLTPSLFDATVVADAASRIGGLDSRAVRIETVRGTTRLGFKLAPGVYLETGGIDRVFVVHIMAAPSETLIFWVDADAQHIDEFETVASRLIETLRGG